MAEIRIVPARFWMCGRIIRSLRHEHYIAEKMAGGDPHRQAQAVFRASYFTRAFTIEGELAAVCGAIGSHLSPFGFVWLLMSEKTTHYPKEIVRHARATIAELMKDKIELRTTVIGGDDAGLRLAAFLGFHRGDGEAFSHHGRRTLLRRLRTDPDVRAPLGQAYVVHMAYTGAEMH
jgi:hypothetical protein